MSLKVVAEEKVPEGRGCNCQGGWHPLRKLHCTGELWVGPTELKGLRQAYLIKGQGIPFSLHLNDTGCLLSE